MNATEIVSEATRRALDEVAELPDGARLRAAVVLLDVYVPDEDEPDGEGYTHTVWKCAPDDMSSSWAHGMCSIAAGAMLLSGHASMDDDE